jgi:hypothetical protein
MMAFKYVSVFWLKNPFGLQDEFWSFYFNLFVVCFSLLSQSVGDFLPGAKTMSYFICTGGFPENILPNVTPTKNVLVELVTNCSVGAYIVYWIRIYYFHMKNKAKASNKSIVLVSLENFSSNISMFIVIILAAILLRKINFLDLTNVNEFPSYIYIYLLQLGIPSLFCSVQCFFNYLQHLDLRLTVWREIKQLVMLS